MMDYEEAAAVLPLKIVEQLGKVLGRTTPATKQELKEIEKDLAAMSQEDADALVEANTMELLLRFIKDAHFDVVVKCLMTLSAYDSARSAMFKRGLNWLAEQLLMSTKAAKTDKQIDRATMLARVVVLYCVDAPDEHLGWLMDMAHELVEALRHALNSTQGQQHAYTCLTVVLPMMWISSGTSLAPIMASNLIECGGGPLLLRQAKEVQRGDIKGLPKINGEKALNLLCAINMEQPQLLSDQIPVQELAEFCFETVSRSDWVQSQELSIVLLGRLIYLQKTLDPSYLETKPVLDMMQAAMKNKSPALRMTTACLVAIAPQSVISYVDVEFHLVLKELGEGTPTSVKRLASPTAGGMQILKWGQPLSDGAKELLRDCKLLCRMAEMHPQALPPQLVALLPFNLRTVCKPLQAANGWVAENATAGALERSGDAEFEYEDEPNGHTVQAQQPAGRSAGPGRVDSAARSGSQPGAAPSRPPVSSAAQRAAALLAAAELPSQRGLPQNDRFKQEQAWQSDVGDPADMLLNLTKAPRGGHKRGREESAKFGADTDSEGSHSHPSAEYKQQKGAQDVAVKQQLPSSQQYSQPIRTGSQVQRAGQGRQPPQAGAWPGTTAGAASQQHAVPAVDRRAGSAGGAPSLGSSGGQVETFTSSDFSRLNSFIYEMMQQAATMDERAQSVVQLLMEGAKQVPQILRNKLQLPPTVAQEVEAQLRQWSQRVHQMGGNLPAATGPALDMLVSFSNMMLDEIKFMAMELEQKVQQG